MAREESELLYFSNKFKNGISNARKNTKAIFSNKADQIKAEHNAEEQKAINLETQGNGKYTEDGILGRVFGINTIPAETELSKYDMISYKYGYYDASNVTIIPISKVSFGFVAGGSEFKGETIEEYNRKDKDEEITYKNPFGGGSGAGVNISPVELSNPAIPIKIK